MTLPVGVVALCWPSAPQRRPSTKLRVNTRLSSPPDLDSSKRPFCTELIWCPCTDSVRLISSCVLWRPKPVLALDSRWRQNDHRGRGHQNQRTQNTQFRTQHHAQETSHQNCRWATIRG